MLRYLLLFLLCLVLPAALFAQAPALFLQPPTYAAGQSAYGAGWQVALAAVPTSPTTVTGTSAVGSTQVKLNSIFCDTSTSTSASVTIVDAVSGTPVWSSVVIAGNTVYSFSFLGLTLPGGVRWSSSGGAVYCWLQGGY